jgi:hypothetical protein
MVNIQQHKETMHMLFRELSPSEEVDFRQWARDNYKVNSEIEGYWHPVVQAECAKMNAESATFVKDTT